MKSGGISPAKCGGEMEGWNWLSWWHPYKTLLQWQGKDPNLIGCPWSPGALSWLQPCNEPEPREGGPLLSVGHCGCKPCWFHAKKKIIPLCFQHSVRIYGLALLFLQWLWTNTRGQFTSQGKLALIWFYCFSLCLIGLTEKDNSCNGGKEKCLCLSSLWQQSV